MVELSTFMVPVFSTFYVVENILVHARSVYVAVTIVGYKYQAETLKEQPGDWVVATNGWRSH